MNSICYHTRDWTDRTPVPVHVTSESPFASVSKQVLVQNISYENEFDLHENESASEFSHKTRFNALPAGLWGREWFKHRGIKSTRNYNN